MPYRIELTSQVGRQIVSWGLPDVLFVETHLRLRRDLSENPARILVRTRQPFDGMSYHYSIIDPGNRLRVYFFVFHVMYSQDEERLIVIRGGCRWSEGL